MTIQNEGLQARAGQIWQALREHAVQAFAALFRRNVYGDCLGQAALLFAAVLAGMPVGRKVIALCAPPGALSRALPWAWASGTSNGIEKDD